ncbi:hypothetical protein EYZ11_012307 [Aspergillus tanneri]|uniref:F-box domain-containing protein n=1 Tax=Aspergillus tanneri TaxID=1220188 RepID=A0A4S3J0L3_9EURO|nr:uncharacterized protein ATNIH1004_011659 [Aspergillus tanneri]KAA8641523.1 hypothetical protein ATNIH1004_011659 [Aspergillus tanneri]THC88246.1 hypothetical protein EYZ11_012307 [Aspergillus tanneri]
MFSVRDGLPVEIVCHIVRSLDPFDALRFSYTSRRLYRVIRGFDAYWQCYRFRGAEDFITKRQQGAVGLIRHMVAYPGPNIDVAAFESILRVLESESIWCIDEYKDAIRRAQGLGFSSTVWLHSRRVISQSISLSIAVGAFECAGEGMQLLDEIGSLVSQPMEYQQWLSPIQETLSHAAHAGAYRLFAQGMVFLEDIVVRMELKVDYGQWVQPLSHSSTRWASLGEWNKFQQTTSLLEYIARRAGRRIDYTKWMQPIGKAISRSTLIGAWESVEMGRQILRHVSLKAEGNKAAPSNNITDGRVGVCSTSAA